MDLNYINKKHGQHEKVHEQGPGDQSRKYESLKRVLTAGGERRLQSGFSRENDRKGLILNY